MADTLTTQQSCANVAKILEDLPALIVAETFVDAAAAWNEVFYDALLAATPIQGENKSGGLFKEPGSLRESLDSSIDLDSRIRGVRAGVGFRGQQALIAMWVEYGHKGGGAIKGRWNDETFSEIAVDSVPPHPFMRPVIDSNAPDQALAAFAKVIEDRLPSVAASSAAAASGGNNG